MSNNERKMHRGETLMVPNQCINARNSHNYLHCPDCQANGVVGEPCSISECPCNGKGTLFRTNRINRVSHQMPNESKSAAILINKPAQARDRIRNLSESFIKAGSTTSSLASSSASTTDEEAQSARKKKKKESADPDSSTTSPSSSILPIATALSSSSSNVQSDVPVTFYIHNENNAQSNMEIQSSPCISAMEAAGSHVARKRTHRSDSIGSFPSLSNLHGQNFDEEIPLASPAPLESSEYTYLYTEDQQKELLNPNLRKVIKLGNIDDWDRFSFVSESSSASSIDSTSADLIMDICKNIQPKSHN